MYEQILADIANFRIRGAENITKWGVLAFSLKIKELDSKCSFISTYLVGLTKFQQEILSLRENEVSLKNSLHYVFSKVRYHKSQTLEEIKSDVNDRLRAIESRINFSHLKISSLGSIKINSGMKVYVHGHSSFVEGILEEAHKHNSFHINVTESVMPIKEYIEKLTHFGKVTYYPFSMVETIVSNSDIIILGATAVKRDNVLCQAGSNAVVSLAKVFDVPVYVVIDVLKYSSSDKYSLEPLAKEDALGGSLQSVKVVSNELDAIEGRLFDGVICEEGIYSYSDFTDLAKKELKCLK